jgi:hypothetical protein
MITGEERIREHLGQLYGNVNQYEGRPGDYQAGRADSLGRELEDVINEFKQLTDRELSSVNSSLRKKKMDAITVLTEADWRKKRDQQGGSGNAGSAQLGMREVD